MANILSIESAVSGFSVAVHKEGVLLSSVELLNQRVASSHLTTAITQVIAFSEIDLQDLDAITVSEGPGSYTGLRIGVSTAKGLCVALDLPLISVNTLALMCYGLNLPITDKLTLCPLIDARRMEVYTALYDYSTKKCLAETSAKIVDENTFDSILKVNKVVFFGNGADKIKTFYDKSDNALFLNEVHRPAAKDMGALAWESFQKQNFQPLVEFEPQYLKPYFATTPKNKLSPQ